MNSSQRLVIIAASAAAVVAIIVAFVLADTGSDSDEGLVANPTATGQSNLTATTRPTAKPSPTARPTITPVPTATSTPGPTPTPAPTATPTPSPTATPTPPPPPSHTEEMGRLIFEKGVEGTQLSVTSVGAATWPNAALGCPEPGVFYDVIGPPYSGFFYVLSDRSNSWEYHVLQDDSITVRCSEIEPTTNSSVNIGQEAALRLTESVSLMRRNFTTDQFEEVSPLADSDAGRLANIFNSDVALSAATDCATVFRLDFHTSEGDREIEFMCSDDKNAGHVFWNGLEGRAPVIGRIIGPYLTGGPIPRLSTASP